jgi:hypothetical protein
MRTFFMGGFLVFSLAMVSGCDEGNQGECDPANPDCAEGLVCEPVQGGNPTCVAPLVLRGRVVDATDDGAIEGALVQAVDPNGAATGSAATTGSDGEFELTVPSTRGEDGKPLAGAFTLRVQAAGYQPFPTAIRPALPVDAANAVEEDGDWVVENAATTVALLPLPGDTSGLGSISGTILAEPAGGILVVAEGGGLGLTGYSGSDGGYTIFNVPAGSYSVHGYTAGVQLDPADVTLAAGEDQTGVDLAAVDRPLSTVSGNLQIVNAQGGATTSVVLVVEATFVEDVARGEVPPGLRVGEVSTSFSIADVPDGRYVVLAAFENDGLVRDPDQTIGGTQIVHIEVPDPESGNTVTLGEGFKITGALEVLSPGAAGPEAVTSVTPLLRWADDSSEEGYEVTVYDAFGEQVWNQSLPEVSGGGAVEVTYAGPALEPGMLYQFRALSFRDKGGTWTAISATEDLKGVFFLADQP